MIKNNLDDFLIDYSLCEKYSIEILKKYKILPIKEYDIFILVASVCDYEYPGDVYDIFDKPVKFLVVEQKKIELEFAYLKQKIELYHLALNSLNNQNDETKSKKNISLFCDNLFDIAIKLQSSDIHIESLKDTMVIRFRIHGIMVQFFKFNWEFCQTLSSIIKLFASLDISLKRLPQDGRFSKTINNNEYDFRVSTLPIINGESIVIRILDNKKAYIKLEELGLDLQSYDAIVRNIALKNGMILITGATGSGKTTTIYSILNKLNNKQKKIISIEDPVEYNLEGVMQVNINNEIGLSYENVLKNILRQDPDILMIGEIRDKNSLQIAIQASLTGHLVLATLHTNDAASTIDRLLDLEAEPFLIASTLRLIISQRLIRVLCDNCKVKVGNYYKAVGCEKCNLSGFSKREVVAENLEIDSKIAKMIQEKTPTQDILSYANYTPIKQIIYDKVLNGITSLDEYNIYEI